MLWRLLLLSLPIYHLAASMHRHNFRSLFSLTLAFLFSRRLLIIFWLWCLSSFVMIIAEFLSCHPWAWINGCRLPLCHIGSTNSPSSLNEAPLASLSISCLSSWALDPLLGQSMHHPSNQSLTLLYHAWARTTQKDELYVVQKPLYVYSPLLHTFKYKTEVAASQGQGFLKYYRLLCEPEFTLNCIYKGRQLTIQLLKCQILHVIRPDLSNWLMNCHSKRNQL